MAKTLAASCHYVPSSVPFKTSPISPIITNQNTQVNLSFSLSCDFFSTNNLYAVHLEKDGRSIDWPIESPYGFRPTSSQQMSFVLPIGERLLSVPIYGTWNFKIWLNDGSGFNSAKIVSQGEYRVSLSPNQQLPTLLTCSPACVGINDSVNCNLSNVLPNIKYNFWWDNDWAVKTSCTASSAGSCQFSVAGQNTVKTVSLCMMPDGFNFGGFGLNCLFKSSPIDFKPSSGQCVPSGGGTGISTCPTDPNNPTVLDGVPTALGCVATKPEDFVAQLLGWVIGLGGGIAFLLIVWGGFQVVTSSGDPEKLNAGKEIIVSALTGLLMIVFSVILLRIIGVDILHIPGFGKP